MDTETSAGPSPEVFLFVWLWLPSQKGKFLDRPQRHMDTEVWFFVIVILSTMGVSLIRLVFIVAEASVIQFPYAV